MVSAMAKSAVVTYDRNANKRNVRVDDALWDRALNLAASDGVTVSDVVREALAQYVARREPVASK